MHDPPLTRVCRRRDPSQSADYLKETDRRRAASSEAFRDKFAWQSDESVDPLIEFKRRQKEGKVNPIGYEDEEQGGIPMPMASFGVGGEFGQVVVQCRAVE